MSHRKQRRIGLLSAWPWDVARGGGTARFLLDLKEALRDQDVAVIPIDADLDPQDYPSYVEKRLTWNRRLRDDPRIRRLDLLLALDCDGSDLPEPPHGPPRIVCPQAVFVSVAETEPEPFRTLLRRMADAERRNVQGASGIIVPSRYAADCVIRSYGADPSRIQVIPHGFDLECWSGLLRAASKEDRDGATVLTVANLYPRKGIATLLNAVSLLRERVPGLRLEIVGAGIEWERLHRLSDTLRLGEIVRFEGSIVDRARLAAFYANADIFCLPSRHETFGFAFLEAMAASLPVVAARAGAAVEVVGDAGGLVPEEDPEQLAAEIGGILLDPARARRMGEKGRRRAAGFSWPVAACRYLDLIESVLASR